MSSLFNSMADALKRVGRKVQHTVDNIFPQEKRAETMTSLRTFAEDNPRLAAFFAIQITFTGLPLLLFLTFCVTVFIFSLATVLLVSIIAALVFTISMASLALLVFLPTAFFTTFAATFLFIWGLGAYYIFQRFVGGQAPGTPHSTIGAKITDLKTGGRAWLKEWESTVRDDAKLGIENTPKTSGTNENEGILGKTSDHSEGSNSLVNVRLQSNSTAKSSDKLLNGTQKQTQDLSTPEGSTVSEVIGLNSEDD